MIVKYLAIIIILVILIIGGFFAWQYFGVVEVEGPEIASVEFVPPLQTTGVYPFEYKSGTTMIIKGKYDNICLAASAGTGIEPTCTKNPIVRRTEDSIDVAEFKLNYTASLPGETVPFCHRLSDFHEIHFLDQEQRLVKKIFCDDTLNYLKQYSRTPEEEVTKDEREKTECDMWREECTKEGDSLCGPCGCSIGCCEGLVRRDMTYPWKTENNEVVCVEEMTAQTCVKCGDGICGKRESWCICPEDCEKLDTEDLPLMPKL